MARHFGHSYGFEHEPTGDADDLWGPAVLAIALVLFGGIAIYALGTGDGSMIASGTSVETTGQSTRPTLPALPQ